MILPPFPIHALPRPLRLTLLGCLALTKTPPESLASSLMCVVHQDAVDVIRPPGPSVPISLYIVSTTESGERKSSAACLENGNAVSRLPGYQE